MRSSATGLDFSASDLSRHSACRHLTALDLCVAKGLRSAPEYHDPAVDILAQRGLEHERRYVDGLKEQGLTVVDLSDVGDRADSVGNGASSAQHNALLIGAGSRF